MIVMDTDTCVELLRGNRTVVDRRSGVGDDVGISFMTAAELHYGVFRSADPRKNAALVALLCESVEVLHSTGAIVERFGELKASLASKGERLADADLFVAATAMCHDALLVTGNSRHYDRIEGLELADWTE